MSQSDPSKSEVADRRSEKTKAFVPTVKTATQRKYSPEEKIRIVLEDFRREVTVNNLCRREGIRLRRRIISATPTLNSGPSDDHQVTYGVRNARMTR